MNRYSLKNEPEYDTPWIAAPNNGGDVGDMSDIVDELNRLQSNLTAVTEQRNGAIEILREIRDDEVNAQDEADKFLRDHLPSELSKVIEQRDRLANALDNLVNANQKWNETMMGIIGRPPNWNDSYLNEAKEALRSLTQPEP
jgi:DNA repair exonuclease SbcCD ATPase subunit